MNQDRYKVPRGWKLVRLSDHTTKIGSGLTPRGGHTAYQASGIPLLRSQNVLMQSFSTEGLAYISATTDKEMSQSRVYEGDVLLNITGASIGRACLVPPEFCPANVNQHVTIIRSDGSIYPAYLAAFLASPQMQDFIMELQAGGTRQALTKVQIEGFRIPLPPIYDEQVRIAAALQHKLAAADQTRSAALAQLEAAQALPSAYLNQIFTGPQTQRWPRYSLGNILEIDAQIVDPTLPQYKDLPHVNGENIESGTGHLLYLNTASEDNMTSGK